MKELQKVYWYLREYSLQGRLVDRTQYSDVNVWQQMTKFSIEYFSISILILSYFLVQGFLTFDQMQNQK